MVGWTQVPHPARTRHSRLVEAEAAGSPGLSGGTDSPQISLLGFSTPEPPRGERSSAPPPGRKRQDSGGASVSLAVQVAVSKREGWG